MTVKEVIHYLSQYPEDTLVVVNNWYPHDDDEANNLDGYEISSCTIETILPYVDWKYLDEHEDYVTGNVIGINT